MADKTDKADMASHGLLERGAHRLENVAPSRWSAWRPSRQLKGRLLILVCVPWRGVTGGGLPRLRHEPGRSSAGQNRKTNVGTIVCGDEWSCSGSVT